MLANGGLGGNGQRVLQRGTVELMMTNHFEPGVVNSHIADVSAGCAIADCDQIPTDAVGYGIGGSVVLGRAGAADQFMGPRSQGTFGWLGYFFTEYWVDPAKELTVSFHSQVMWGQFLGLGYEGKGKYIGEMGRVVAEKVYAAMGL